MQNVSIEKNKTIIAVKRQSLHVHNGMVELLRWVEHNFECEAAF